MKIIVRLWLLIGLLVGLAAMAEAKDAVADQGQVAAGEGNGPSLDWQACLPKGVSKVQVRNAVLAWLKKYPKFGNVALSTLVAKVEGWLRKHPEFRDPAVTALITKAHAWIDKHPQYRDVPAAALMAKDISEGLPCQ